MNRETEILHAYGFMSFDIDFSSVEDEDKKALISFMERRIKRRMTK